jgi:hypothetical protein
VHDDEVMDEIDLEKPSEEHFNVVSNIVMQRVKSY